MNLKHLNLTNFRNYPTLKLEFDSRPTVLLGDNGAGKSNILEAIYFLSTTKSARVEQDLELIKEGEVMASVECRVQSEETEELQITMVNDEQGFKKQLKVNGVPRRMVDFIGNLPAIIFYPSDINLVTGSPSLRRWHLDLGLVQIDSEYKKTLTQYEQILTSRNRVLKRIREGEGRMDELTYWTEELIGKGKIVSEKRKEFFEFVNSLKKDLGDFEYRYNQSLITPERLEQYSGREIAAAVTLIGPHRDDFVILFNGKNLAKFGSRGEQRTGTLSFKLSQLEFMAKVLGVRPILLLDDVFSELDANHRAYVTQISTKQQTIISTVELENISEEFLKESRLIKVENGKITE